MTIPREAENATLTIGRKRVPVTNVNKVFFPEIGVTKGDLLQYYADVSDVLLPHIAQRAMVMKRYPHGASGRVLLHEAHTATTPGVAANVPNRARLGQCNRLSDDR